MASTISNATMTVVYREDVELNSTKYGTRTEFKIGAVNEVSQRIFSVPTSQVTVLTLSSSAGAGAYVTGDLLYARLSNLDDKNFVRLTFLSGSANQYDVKLEARRSYVFTNAKISGSNAAATFDSFVNFDTCKAVADTAAVDLELFLASK